MISTLCSSASLLLFNSHVGYQAIRSLLSLERWIAVSLWSILILLLLHQRGWCLMMRTTNWVRLHYKVCVLARGEIASVSISNSIRGTKGMHRRHCPRLSNCFNFLGSLSLKCPLFIYQTPNGVLIPSKIDTATAFFSSAFICTGSMVMASCCAKYVRSTWSI